MFLRREECDDAGGSYFSCVFLVLQELAWFGVDRPYMDDPAQRAVASPFAKATAVIRILSPVQIVVRYW